MQQLTDTFGRSHTYLRISLTDKCNLRCSYCMPEEDMCFMSNKRLMTADEVVEIAATFVRMGVNKIRLTGGEPLIRSDFREIFTRLSALPVRLHLTTNGVLLDQHLIWLIEAGLKDINISLDSLEKDKFVSITKRDHHEKVTKVIQRACDLGVNVKLNTVLMKGMNEDEIIDFIRLTQNNILSVRFIEFMPFDGNKWNFDKTVLLYEVLTLVRKHYQVNALEEGPNQIAKQFQVKGFQGDFGVISTVSSPFCGGCNRIRITADGKLKNCLFATEETDLLTAYRKGEYIAGLIHKNILGKKEVRSGMKSLNEFKIEGKLHKNRAMVAIGG